MAGNLSKSLDYLIKGNKIVLYENGKIIEASMRRALLTDKDLHSSLRHTLQSDYFEGVKCACMKCNGEISSIRKSEKYPKK